MQKIEKRRLKQAAWISALIVLVAWAGSTAPSRADSAIALVTDGRFIFGVSFGMPDEQTARQDAMTRCLAEGGSNCAIAAYCEGGGYGAISVRQIGPGAPVEAYGYSCGQGTMADATRAARGACEYAVAQDLGAVLPPLEDLSDTVLRQRLIRACPGLGNCHCNERAGWKDQGG